MYSLYAGKQAVDDEDIDDLLNSMNGGGVDADGTGGDDLEVRLAALPADSGDEGSKSKCEYHLVKEIFVHTLPANHYHHDIYISCYA